VPALEHLIREDVGVGVDYRRRGAGMSRYPTMIQPVPDLSAIRDAVPGAHGPGEYPRREAGMKWDTKLRRALFTAATIAALILSAIAETTWTG
jgi:hypothetical protein